MGNSECLKLYFRDAMKLYGASMAFRKALTLLSFPTFVLPRYRSIEEGLVSDDACPISTTKVLGRI